MFAMSNLLFVSLAAAAVAVTSDPVSPCPSQSGDGPRVIRVSPEQAARWMGLDAERRLFVASAVSDEFQPAAFRRAMLPDPMVWRTASLRPQDVVVKRDGQSVTRSKSVIVITDESGELKVVDEDGQVQAFRNGKPVPPERIKRQYGKIIIMDENGQVLREVSVGGGGAKVRLGDVGAVLKMENMPEGAILEGMLKMENLPEGAFKVLGLGATPRPRIGVSMGPVDPALAEHLGIDAQGSFVITAVEDGLPAAKAGLQKNDIVVRVNEGTAEPDRLREIVSASEAGDEIRIRILRKGEPKDVVVRVEKVADSNHPILRLDALDGKLGDIEGRILRLMPEAAQKLREFRVKVDGDRDVDFDFDVDVDLDHDADFDAQFDQDFMRHFDAMKKFDVQIEGVPQEALQKLRERMKAGGARLMETFDQETILDLQKQMHGAQEHILRFMGEQGDWRERIHKAIQEALQSSLADKVDDATREKIEQKVREALDQAGKAGERFTHEWKPVEKGVMTFELAPNKEGGQVMILPEAATRVGIATRPAATIEHRLEALEARLAKLEALLEKLGRDRQPLP